MVQPLRNHTGGSFFARFATLSSSSPCSSSRARFSLPFVADDDDGTDGTTPAAAEVVSPAALVVVVVVVVAVAAAAPAAPDGADAGVEDGSGAAGVPDGACVPGVRAELPGPRLPDTATQGSLHTAMWPPPVMYDS